MTKSEPTVFIVDDDTAVLKGLRMLQKSVNLNAETYLSAPEFLNDYDPERPGCLILDIRMPGMSGLELQETLKQRNIAIPIIVITGHGDVPIAILAMKNGAMDFLEKPFSDQILLDQVQNALAADAQTRKQQAVKQYIFERINALTPRETEVLTHVVAGKPNKAVAYELGCSQKTVEFHRANIMRKMQVDSLAELVTTYVNAKANA